MAEDLKNIAEIITANVTANLIGCTKDVLTTEEAAKYLGVSKSCLYKWTMNRQIPHYKSQTGKMCYFNRKEIESWMQSCRIATDEELEVEAKAIMSKRARK